MTTESDSAEARASREATDWFILLQDEPEDAELRHRFDAWLAAGPINRAAWAMTQRISGSLVTMPLAHASQWQPFIERKSAGGSTPARSSRASPVQRGRWYKNGWKLGSGVAAVGVAACVAFLLGPAAILRLRADYVTGTAELQTVTLADGSTVTLAPDSAITVAYSNGERRVGLLAGEAFFTVKHNPDRPFHVIVGRVEATDVGTAFDVRRGDEGVAVAVQQGSVRVDEATAEPPVSDTLTAGQMVRVAWAGGAVRGDEPPNLVAAWRQSQLIAEDQPMRNVIDQLRPYFSGRIILTNNALADRPVTGVYNLANPVEALRGIAQAQGESVRRITPWLLVVSGG